MTKRTKTGLLMASGILALPIAFIVYSCYELGRAGRYDQHQSDAALIESFNRHRAEFEQLRTMAMEDETLRYLDDDAVLPAEIDLVKVDEYRRLLKVAGLRGGMIRDATHIEFLSSSNGWGPSGSIKGYIVLMDKLDRTERVESLDSPTNVVEDTYFLRRIEDNWFLYFVTK